MLARTDKGGKPQRLSAAAGAADSAPLGPTAKSGDWLTLGLAATKSPGRPSANCVWRWCRRGVLSRAGHRICLQHIRVGGKIFTNEAWLGEFFEKVADADAAYFAGAGNGRDIRDAEKPGNVPPVGFTVNKKPRVLAGSVDPNERDAQLQRRLEEEGL